MNSYDCALKKIMDKCRYDSKWFYDSEDLYNCREGTLRSICGVIDHSKYNLDIGCSTNKSKEDHKMVKRDKHYRSRGEFFKKVIFNDPATIVFWNDGTKTVVKCSKNDKFDKEKGLAMAVCKKFFGSDYAKIFKNI